ncbi:uncharacterized protein C2845_PM15G01260 [Panicum miliaceum]|uniref:KIB1-4 beta-propeller domain-containing protein n=1 Tax=Panicum miliaceum TaxID=4540 RepID=A0A3L6QDZ1_PANMI|nr:uncharacterized protein C2845_PM15G01260 [Panicum miliaceum]
MAVHKHSRSCVFRVQVLDEERGQWEETKDIGNAALFVGVNSSMCVPTEQHPGLVAGCVYFTNDQLGEAHMDWGLLQRYGSTNSGYGMELRDRDVGVFNLRDGKVGKVEGLGLHPFWPLPAWFTPLIS